MSPTHKDENAAARGRHYKFQSPLLHSRTSINHIGEVARRCAALRQHVLSIIALPIKRMRWGETVVALVGVTPPVCISFLKWGSSRGAVKGGREDGAELRLYSGLLLLLLHSGED